MVSFSVFTFTLLTFKGTAIRLITNNGMQWSTKVQHNKCIHVHVQIIYTYNAMTTYTASFFLVT